MLEQKVQHLSDRKLSILLFLIDYAYYEKTNKTIFGESYIKGVRNPEPIALSEIFDIIANDEDLAEDDERLYLIQELFEYIDMSIESKESYIEIKFLDIGVKFDSDIFEPDEYKTLEEIVQKYKNDTPRNVANATFGIDKVRQTDKLAQII
jgi:hypothetical protein